MTSRGISSTLQRVMKPTFALTDVHVDIGQLIFDDLLLIGCQAVDLILARNFWSTLSHSVSWSSSIRSRLDEKLIDALCPILDPRRHVVISVCVCVSTSPLNTAIINRSCPCSFGTAAVLALVVSCSMFDRLLTQCLLVLVGCSLSRCVLLLVQFTMCFLTRATQLCLASLPAPSASSPEPRSIQYFWVRSRCVLTLALFFTFHVAVFDSSHWPWVWSVVLEKARGSRWRRDSLRSHDMTWTKRR